MLEDNDVEKLIVAFKEIFATKEDLVHFKNDLLREFNKLNIG
jgi:hypothetical protein